MITWFSWSLLCSQGSLLTTQQSQCKRNRSRSESGEKAGRKESGEDGKFTLLVEKSEKSNEFGVTVKETDTNYPVITAVQRGKLVRLALARITLTFLSPTEL